MQNVYDLILLFLMLFNIYLFAVYNAYPLY